MVHVVHVVHVVHAVRVRVSACVSARVCVRVCEHCELVCTAKHAKYLCRQPHALHPAPCVPRALCVAIECVRPFHVARALRVACDWGRSETGGLDRKWVVGVKCV